MTNRPYTIRLSEEELAILHTGVRQWEGLLRTSRPWEKEDEEALSKLEREIADCRNLKARLFRLKPSDGGDDA